MGESGAGKSTLVGLLLRFYDVNHGDVLINGINIKDYDLVSLRKKMGLVMQEPTLFNYSIAENVLYGKMDATNQEILEACKVANSLEFIESGEIKNTYSDNAQDLLEALEQVSV